MAYAPKRSKNASLEHGTTEGAYIYDRPNTEDTAPNTDATLAARRSLNPLNMFTTASYPAKVNPGR